MEPRLRPTKKCWQPPGNPNESSPTNRTKTQLNNSAKNTRIQRILIILPTFRPSYPQPQCVRLPSSGLRLCSLRRRLWPSPLRSSRLWCATRASCRDGSRTVRDPSPSSPSSPRCPRRPEVLRMAKPEPVSFTSARRCKGESSHLLPFLFCRPGKWHYRDYRLGDGECQSISLDLSHVNSSPSGQISTLGFVNDPSRALSSS